MLNEGFANNPCPALCQACPETQGGQQSPGPQRLTELCHPGCRLTIVFFSKRIPGSPTGTGQAKLLWEIGTDLKCGKMRVIFQIGFVSSVGPIERPTDVQELPDELAAFVDFCFLANAFRSQAHVHRSKEGCSI